MICALAIPDEAFKACCMRSGKHDGANRKHYFQGVSEMAGMSGHFCVANAYSC